MMSFRDRVLRKLDPTAAGKVSVVEAGDDFDWDALPEGIVTLHATWSVPSFKVIREYTSLWAASPVLSEIPYFILDIDAQSNERLELLSRICRLGGNGETFFIRSGQVVQAVPHYSPDFLKTELITFEFE